MQLFVKCFTIDKREVDNMDLNLEIQTVDESCESTINWYFI